MAYIADSGSRPFLSFAAVAEGLKSLNHKLKYGRMMSVLSQMSDAQLDQIGINRSDIPAHAEKLISR